MSVALNDGSKPESINNDYESCLHLAVYVAIGEKYPSLVLEYE